MQILPGPDTCVPEPCGTDPTLQTRCRWCRWYSLVQIKDGSVPKDVGNEMGIWCVEMVQLGENERLEMKDGSVLKGVGNEMGIWSDRYVDP